MDFESNIIKFLKISFARLVYRMKAHELESRLLKRKEIFLKLLTLLVAFGSYILISLSIVLDEEILAIFSSIVSLILLIFTIIQFNSEYSKSIRAHEEAVNYLRKIKDKHISLLTNFSTMSINILENERIKIAKEVRRSYELAPQVSEAASRKARKKLKIENEFSINDEEIEKILPINLSFKVKKN